MDDCFRKALLLTIRCSLFDLDNDSEWDFSFTDLNSSRSIEFAASSHLHVILCLDPKNNSDAGFRKEKNVITVHLGQRRGLLALYVFDNQSLNINRTLNQSARECKHISKHFLWLPEWGLCTLETCSFVIFCFTLFSVWINQVKHRGQGMTRAYKKAQCADAWSHYHVH